MLPLAPRFGMNVYLAGTTLIDAGTRRSAQRIIAALRAHNKAIGIPVASHALTHVHPDHQGGSAAVCTALSVPLWAPEPEADHAERGDTRTLVPDSLVTRLQQRFWQGSGHPVERTLSQGDCIGAGFSAIETPGHSPGHLAFWRERDRVLIVGDCVWGLHPITGRRTLREPPRMFTLDPAHNRASIRALAALRPDVICFGHGPVLRNAAEPFARFAASL